MQRIRKVLKPWQRNVERLRPRRLANTSKSARSHYTAKPTSRDWYSLKDSRKKQHLSA